MGKLGFIDLQVEVRLRDETHPIWIKRKHAESGKSAPGVKYTLIAAQETLWYWTEYRTDCVEPHIRDAMEVAIKKVMENRA